MTEARHDQRTCDLARDRSQLQDLLEERGLAHDTMDVTRVRRINEDMERADATASIASFVRI
jgi:hypothetical protein